MVKVRIKIAQAHPRQSGTEKQMFEELTLGKAG
jgi:hypothetical protein